MPYVECALTFIDDHHALYVDDGRFRGAHGVNGTVSGDELSLDTVRKLNEWVQKHPEHCRRPELALLGRHLYRIAFETPSDDPAAAGKTPLHQAFESTLDRFKAATRSSPSTRMRIKLVFEREAEKLAGLPWEFLYLANDNLFLAQRAELILTRFVPDQDWGSAFEPDHGSEKLRILVVKSEPRELADVQSAPTVDEIKKLQSDLVDVKIFAGRPTLTALRDCICGSEDIPGYRPHIVHLMGHGRAARLALMKEESQLRTEEAEAAIRRRDAERRGQLVVHETVEEAHWLDMESVKSLFDGHKPRVVFLHACQGAAPDSLETFRNTARELAYSNIPAVIAMQYEIGNNEADVFAKTFYTQLRRGTNVDEAVTAARQELGRSVFQPGRNVWDERSFGTPVIYLQTEKPIILAPPAVSDRASAHDPPPGPSKVPCPNPDCNGFVIVGRSLCLKCRKALTVCPECGVMMLTEAGICDFGHRLDAARPGGLAAAGIAGMPGGLTGEGSGRP